MTSCLPVQMRRAVFVWSKGWQMLVPNHPVAVAVVVVVVVVVVILKNRFSNFGLKAVVDPQAQMNY